MSDSLKKQTKKGLYWKAAEKFSEQGIQFIIGIVMARLLSPSDYGITALPAVFMSISGVLMNAGFAQALVRKPDLKEEDLSTAYIYSMSVGAVCYVALFFASPWIADFYNTPVLKSLMRVTALSFLYSPIGTPQGVLLQRRLDFKTPAKISVIVRILGGIVGITLAYMGYGVWALVISGMVSGIVGQIIKICVVRWYPKTGWSKESFKYLWGFGNKVIGSRLLDDTYKQITPIIVGKYYSTADLGVYNRAWHYASLPSSFLHNIIRDVTFPVMSKMQDDKDRLIRNYRRMINVSAFISFPLMMLMSALARPLVITMVTSKWESCIILLQIICFSRMWFTVHAMNLNILQVTGRTDLFFRLEVIKKIFGLVVLCASLPFGLVAFCAAGVASSVVHVYINTWYTGKYYGFGFKEQMKDLAPILGLSFMMFLCVLGLTQLISNMLLQLIIGGMVGFIIYVGGAYFLKFDQLNDVKYMLRRK